MADDVPLVQLIRERLTLMHDPAGALAMLPDPLPSDPVERAELLQLRVSACVTSGEVATGERPQAARLVALREAGRDAAADAEERTHDVLFDPKPRREHLPVVSAELERALASEPVDPELVAGLYISAVSCSPTADALELAEAGLSFCAAHPASTGEFSEFLQFQAVNLLNDLGLGNRAVAVGTEAAQQATFRWVRASLWRLVGLLHGNRLEFAPAAEAFQEAFEVLAQIGYRTGMVETAETVSTMSRLAGTTEHAAAMLSVAFSLGLEPTAERLVTFAELLTQAHEEGAGQAWVRALEAQRAEGASDEVLAQSHYWQGVAALQVADTHLAEFALRAAVAEGTDPVVLAALLQLAETPRRHQLRRRARHRRTGVRARRRTGLARACVQRPAAARHRPHRAGRPRWHRRPR